MKVTMTVTYQLDDGETFTHAAIERGFKEALAGVSIDELNTQTHRSSGQRWMPSADAARALHLSERTLRLRAERGEILRKRNGKAVLYQVAKPAPVADGLQVWMPGPDAADALGISLRTLQRCAEAGQVLRRKTGKETQYLLTPEVAAACGIGAAARQHHEPVSAAALASARDIKSGLLAALKRYGKLDGTCIIVCWLTLGRMPHGESEIGEVKAVLEGMNSTGEAVFTVIDRGAAPEMWEVLA